MPNREIREGIRHSEIMAKLTDTQFRLFVNLITCVDDYGRFHADPRLVKSACFPYDTKSVSCVSLTILELEKSGVIDLFSKNGKDYLVIKQWRQRVRARASKFPDPNDLDVEKRISPSSDSQATDTRRALTDNDITNNDITDNDINNILKVWKELFPDKPQPRVRTFRAKLKTRWKDEHFRSNWPLSLKSAAASPTCQKESWFNFDFFVRNDENYQKMMEGWMSWKDDQLEATASKAPKKMINATDFLAHQDKMFAQRKAAEKESQ